MPAARSFNRRPTPPSTRFPVRDMLTRALDALREIPSLLLLVGSTSSYLWLLGWVGNL